MSLPRRHFAATVMLVAAATASIPAAPHQSGKITQAEVAVLLREQADCERVDQIYIGRFEYFDFTGDGQDEAVVVASTCMTGTAGPDVHSVFTRKADGTLGMLLFDGDATDAADWRFADQPKGLPVFGNANFGLTVEQGELVARWVDGSDRKEPAVIWFKWNGRRFVHARTKIQGPFPTSYDCAKATVEVERAICYSPSVAALDVKLGEAYQARLRQLAPEQRQALQSDERRWLAARARSCTIYKWWVDCLTELYVKRIAELNGR